MYHCYGFVYTHRQLCMLTHEYQHKRLSNGGYGGEA